MYPAGVLFKPPDFLPGGYFIKTDCAVIPTSQVFRIWRKKGRPAAIFDVVDQFACTEFP
jgi:hypothetical protein